MLIGNLELNQWGIEINFVFTIATIQPVSKEFLRHRMDTSLFRPAYKNVVLIASDWYSKINET